MEQAGVISEFRCSHRTTEDELWIKMEVRPADMRLRILENNLVMFDYMEGDTIVDGYRLCWAGFLQFVFQFKDWFLEQEPMTMMPSCVDRDKAIHCLVHDDLVVSMSIGNEVPKFVFYADRADVLGLFDRAARIVNGLPDAGCFRLAENQEQDTSTTVSDTIEERFANLGRAGHTLH